MSGPDEAQDRTVRDPSRVFLDCDAAQSVRETHWPHLHPEAGMEDGLPTNIFRLTCGEDLQVKDHKIASQALLEYRRYAHC